MLSACSAPFRGPVTWLVTSIDFFRMEKSLSCTLVIANVYCIDTVELFIAEGGSPINLSKFVISRLSRYWYLQNDQRVRHCPRQRCLISTKFANRLSPIAMRIFAI